MSPTPKRQPMVNCPHCGAANDPARGSNLCRNCNLPLSGEAAPITPRAEAMRAAGRILAQARARIAQMTPEQAADAAYVPGGPSRAELAATVRRLRADTSAQRAA